MGLKLFFAPGSCAFAAMTALEEGEADYEPLKLDLAAGDQRTDRFLSVNPLGRVPALIVDDVIVTELLAILSYIAARYPEAGLLADGPLLRARQMEMLSWFSTSIHLHIAQIFRGERFADDEAVRAALKANGLAQFVRALPRIEAACNQKEPVLSKERFTLVNAFSLVVWRWAEKLAVDVSSFSFWGRVVAADLGRSSVQRAIAIEANADRWLPAEIA